MCGRPLKNFACGPKKLKAHISQFIIFKVKIYLEWVNAYQTKFQSGAARGKKLTNPPSATSLARVALYTIQNT